jgi:hypothetical protein
MKTKIFLILFIVSSLNIIYPQSSSTLNSDTIPRIKTVIKKRGEPINNWSLNLLFSNNGFGFGSTIYKQFSKDYSGFAGIFFSPAKDDREFDYTDIYGNTYTPDKVNRLFMASINIGTQIRLFREDVTDNLRPHINFGITPSSIIYTPYDQSFFTSFKYTQAKYTVGGFASIGLDYVTNRSSALSMDVRYYYIHLFGQGVESLQSKPLNNFGGLYLVFSYNFLK